MTFFEPSMHCHIRPIKVKNIQRVDSFFCFLKFALRSSSAYSRQHPLPSDTSNQPIKPYNSVQFHYLHFPQVLRREPEQKTIDDTTISLHVLFFKWELDKCERKIKELKD